MQKKPKKIPKFQSYAQEAYFWDTHDITDYLGELKPVDIKLEKKLTKQETLIVRLQPALKEKIKDFAKKNHLSVSGLARVWFIEKLQENNKNKQVIY